MKRSTVLLLALVALLAQILTIHQDSSGQLGPPADRVHTAFRLGRALVREGLLSFRAGGQPAESYPSWAWVGYSALIERLGLAPTLAAQVLAIGCALLAMLVLSRFSPDRLAGVIAPLLLAVCGPLAAAAGGGTEFALEALLAVSALLAFEAGSRRGLALLLCFGLLVRPEGALMVLMLGAMSLSSRFKRRAPGEPLPPQARLGLWPFALPAALWALQALLRQSWYGALLSPTQALLVDPAWERTGLGLRYLAEGLIGSGGLALGAVALLALLLGRQTPRGRRALALGLGWCALVVLEGGDDLPFWTALAPAAPLLFVAVQEALIRAIDSQASWPRRAAWGLFFAGLGASLLASKLPADLGPLPLERLQRAWFYGQPPDPYPLASGPARLGLGARINFDERLRAIGVFLRDEVEPSRTILTPWPGAIGYLTRGRAIDLLGRAQPIAGGSRTLSWSGRQRVDLLAALAAEPDYILPVVAGGERPPLMREVLLEWNEHFDLEPASKERFERLAAVLRNYEVISVRVPKHSREPRLPSSQPATLLRHRRLGESPELELQASAGRVAVQVKHGGHGQMIDLEISARDRSGQRYNLTPTGDFSTSANVHARTGLWLPNTGNRAIRLFDAHWPKDLDLVEFSAVLRNPGSQDEASFSQVSAERRIELR
jgi:hypothetical protein